MTKGARNKEVEAEFSRQIEERGLEDVLVMDPIPNTFKRRQHFRTKNGIHYFTAFMWQLNLRFDRK